MPKPYNKNPEAMSCLTPEQYRVTREDVTERRGTGLSLQIEK
jgi:peptide methionine sulfoxide reductase MsrB